MSRAPSFVAALRETVRAVFVDDPPDPAELFRLVKEHRLQEALESLRSHRDSWNVRDAAGHTLLHWAALGGHVEFAREALQQGVPADALGGASSGCQTPLMWAVCGGHEQMVCALLDARASPLAHDTRGATAMVHAVQQEQFTTMAVMAERGGEDLLSMGDKNGCTAAHWAAYIGSVEALTRLESLGANLFADDYAGMPPLQHAVWAYRPQAVEYLVQLGSDPMRCNKNGKNSIDIAEERGNPGLQGVILSAMLKRLLAQRNPRPSSPDSKGKDAAEAVALRDLASGTPLALGAAVSWLAAWEVQSPSKGGVEDESDIVKACTSFDLDYVSSVEKLRLALVNRVEGARTILREELLACFMVTDRHGHCVDLFSHSQDELPPDLFPLHARLASLREVSTNELMKVGPSISTGVSIRMRMEPERFRHRVLTRIPASFRWSVWTEALRLKDLELPSGGAYSEMSMRENEWTQLILNDTSRTFMFFDRQQQQSLLRILNAYAVHNPEVGYCQGMNMIAGMLLLLSDNEEESFGVLACLMDEIGLCEFYREGFPLLRSYLSACDELMAEAAPELLEHFTTEGVELSMYLQQWFLTLFIDCLPLPLVVAIWDAIICEGLPIALKVVVSVLTSLEEPLLSMRFQDIATAFKTLRRHSDREGEWKAFEAGHLLVRQAARVKVPARILDYHRQSPSSGRRGGSAGGSPQRLPLGTNARCFT